MESDERTPLVEAPEGGVIVFVVLCHRHLQRSSPNRLQYLGRWLSRSTSANQATAIAIKLSNSQRR